MFTNPVKNLKSLHLREDEIIADLGSGTGFYSLASAYLAPRGKVYAVDKKSSITVFDGTETSSDVTVIGGGFDVPGTFAYLLVPSDVKDGVYTGVVAKNNQREINKIISSSNLIPRYCDGLENWKGCEQLPNMIVTSVTPWMMIVKTLMPDKVGYQVSGIFFQSITGYDYTDGG